MEEEAKDINFTSKIQIFDYPEATQKRKVAFFDMNGTLTYPPLIETLMDIRFEKAMIDEVIKLKDEYLLIIVTNQGGIGAGFKTKREVLNEIHLTNYIYLGVFDYAIYCPFFKSDKNTDNLLNSESTCRKPKYGMFAIIEHELLKTEIVVDWENSFYVGDQESDKKAAEQAGLLYIDAVDFKNANYTLTNTK